jgi:hypothetical protein
MKQSLHRIALILVLAALLAPAAAAESVVIPYLTRGAGVYIDEATGLPKAHGERPSPPRTAGVHVLPPVALLPPPPAPPAPPPSPADPPPPPPADPPSPPPTPADPVYVVDPALGGYYREDLARVAGKTVLCLTDAAWPAASPQATGLWDGVKISMRTWRCDGLVPSKVASELFARGLFVLAHESVHAGGQPNECEADKGGIARMPAFSAGLGFGEAAGAAARDLILSIYRASPLPPPYCLGSF